MPGTGLINDPCQIDGEERLSRKEAVLQAKLKTYLPPLLCAVTPVICYLIVRPFAEIGVDDEWSYIKSAQVLAQTGHIVYNGWATAMLGWQLYFAALFVKLLGFSFTAVRLSTLFEAVATAFLFERTLVRSGINQWNAALATITLVLAPFYLPFIFEFMSDVSGVLCIVLCLYMCLRALEATSRRSAMVWIVAAALVNAVGGTARQIAWLGVLVMVPSTLWLLRRDRRVLVAGSLACIAGAGFVFAAMHWIAQQPYAIPEPLIWSKIDFESWKHLGTMTLNGIQAFVVMLLPVLLMFIPPLRVRKLRMVALISAGSICFVLMGMVLSAIYESGGYSAPSSAVSLMLHIFQRLGLIAAPGSGLDIADDGFLLLRVGAEVAGFFGFLFYFLDDAQDHPVLSQTNAPISWRKLAIVLVPFGFAYMVMLAPRAADGRFTERYALPLVVICLLALTRYYQEKVRANLPIASTVLGVLVASFVVADMHDVFAMSRAYVTAIEKVRSTGVPATAIWGPWEFDGWTEVDTTGYLNDPLIRFPKGAYTPPPPRVIPPHCDDDQQGAPFWYWDWTPAIKPIYATALHATECDGLAGFPPVSYHTWFPPRSRSVYIVKLPAYLSR